MKLKLVTPTAKLPTRATPGASCWDVYADATHVVPPEGSAVVKLGFAVELEPGTEIQVRPRSGLAAKNGIHVHLGTIDSDYRGEVSAILFNLSPTSFVVQSGERIAQMALCPVIVRGFEIVDRLSETERGTGGFGSTGR